VWTFFSYSCQCPLIFQPKYSGVLNRREGGEIGVKELLRKGLKRGQTLDCRGGGGGGGGGQKRFTFLFSSLSLSLSLSLSVSFFLNLFYFSCSKLFCELPASSNFSLSFPGSDQCLLLLVVLSFRLRQEKTRKTFLIIC